MNIFFNSRTYANQSLFHVLLGQKQKTTSSQSAGCKGTKDTLTISASGKEKTTKRTRTLLPMRERRLMRKQVTIGVKITFQP